MKGSDFVIANILWTLVGISLVLFVAYQGLYLPLMNALNGIFG